MWRALVTIPGCGLASSNRNALKCPRLPSIASDAIAVSRSARSASSWDAATAMHANALMNDVPLVSASPSLASIRIGSKPSSASTSAASRSTPSNATTPSPESARPT